jgi:hypothetical protein
VSPSRDGAVMGVRWLPTPPSSPGAARTARGATPKGVASIPDEPTDDQESCRPSPEVLRRAAVYRDDGVTWEQIERTGVPCQRSEWFTAWHAVGIAYRPLRPTGREQR